VSFCHVRVAPPMLSSSPSPADTGASTRPPGAPAAPSPPASVDQPRRGSIGRLRSLPAALSETVTASAAPYGYTLTIWGSGAVLIRSHGTPSVGEVFVFITGALIGFDFLGLVSSGALERRESLGRRRDRVLAAALDWSAVGAAVGAVALLAEVRGWVPWLVGPLVATLAYILTAALQLALVTAGHRSEAPSDRGSATASGPRAAGRQS